jgi:predicted nucleic acid-binding protein
LKVVLDTNVILDVWLAREPYWRDSAAMLARIENREIEGIVCPTTVTTLHYLAKKVLGEQQARDLIGRLLELCGIGVLTAEVFRDALKSGMGDFEDSVISAMAMENRVDFIATRNIRDFRKSPVPAREPAQF